MNDCRCGKPTRDAAYMCDDCAHQLEKALGDIRWLDGELEVTVGRQKGVDYRNLGGSSGGKKDAERPSPVMWAAANARANLKALLITWTLFCNAKNIRHQSPTGGLPDDNLPDIATWLAWRIDGLALHESGSDAADAITEAVATCHRLIDRPPDRQYLGECKELECLGRMWAKPSATFARCDTCMTPVPADDIRKRMLTELDDRLCTAAEIAHLSTYLGLNAGREQVRKRINQWSSRNQITVHPSFSDEPTFRFGEVYERLARDEYATKVG